MAGAVNIRLGAIVTDFVAGFRAAGAAAGQLVSQLNGNLAASFAASDRQSRQFERGLGRFATGLQSFGRQASIVSAAIAGIGIASFRSYGDIDGLQRALKITAGSTEAANQQFAQFRQLAKLPGLGLDEVVQAGVQLETLGYKAQTAQQYISEIGNAIALGGKGKVEFDQVITQFTQMSGKAKVLGDDLKPIVNASPVIAKAIQDMFGTTASDEISKKLEAVGKGPKEFIEGLVISLSKLERVEGGPKNALENLGDAVKISGFEFSKAADQALGLTEKLDGLGNFLTSAATQFGQLSPAAKAAILGVVGFTAVIGPMVLGLGSAINLVRALTLETGALTVGVKALQAAFVFVTGPIGGMVLAATAVVGALAIGLASIQHYGEKLQTTADKAALLADVQAKVSEATAEETTKLQSLLSIAKDETISKKARLKAVADLNAISPEYLGNLRLETINTADATKQIGLYTNALVLKAKVAALQGKVAQASIKFDEIDAKSVNDFVDKSTFSKDQIAVSLKTVFSPVSEQEKLFKELGQKRKSAALSVAQDEAKYYNDQLKKAYAEASKSNIQLEAPQVVIPNYKNVGNDSAIEILKNQQKSAKEAVDSFKAANPGKAVPAELLQNYKTLTDRLKEATAETRNYGRATKATKESQFGDVESLKRLEKYLESTIQLAKGKGVDEQVRQLKSVREQIEKLDALTSKDQKLNITGIKELASPATSSRVNSIVDSFHQMATIAPGLFDKPAVTRYLTEFQKLLPSADYYQNKIQEIQEVISKLSFNGFKIPQTAIDDLAKYKKIQRDAQDSSYLADVAVDNKLGGDIPQVSAIEKMLSQIKAGKDAINLTVQDVTQAMKSGQDQLKLAGAGLLSGLGESIGKGENPLKAALKSILDLVGGYVIQLGTALLLSSAALLAAAPVTFGITLAQGIGQKIAGAGLIIAGGAVKGLAATALESGGLAQGATYALIGESSKARAGGGEFVASVDLGANLIGDRIMKRLANDMQFNRPDMSRVGRQALDLNVTGGFNLRNGDLSAAIDDYHQTNSYFN